VLQHRLPQSPDLVNKTIAPLQDAQRALRYIRAHAAEWGLDPNQIGVMGISAGGHVASSVATHTEDLSAIGDSLDKQTFMPNFSVLISPVISMTEITHKGSHDKLLGEKPSDAVVQAWSSEKLVSAKTCPSLLFHASDDHVVNPMNSILYYSALLKNGVSASLHIFPHGDHKIAILCNPGSTDMWPALTKVWLEEMNILTPLK
jgi:acetyl esterase/lipase